MTKGSTGGRPGSGNGRRKPESGKKGREAKGSAGRIMGAGARAVHVHMCVRITIGMTDMWSWKMTGGSLPV